MDLLHAVAVRLVEQGKDSIDSPPKRFQDLTKEKY